MLKKQPWRIWINKSHKSTKNDNKWERKWNFVVSFRPVLSIVSWPTVVSYIIIFMMPLRSITITVFWKFPILSSVKSQNFFLSPNRGCVRCHLEFSGLRVSIGLQPVGGTPATYTAANLDNFKIETDRRSLCVEHTRLTGKTKLEISQEFSFGGCQVILAEKI